MLLPPSDACRFRGVRKVVEGPDPRVPAAGMGARARDARVATSSADPQGIRYTRASQGPIGDAGSTGAGAPSDATPHPRVLAR